MAIDPLDHLALVGNIAKRYRGWGLDYDDLCGWGNVGLMQAVASYDPGRGTQFSTCAVPWIQMRILRAVRKWRRSGEQLPAFGCTGDEENDLVMANATDGTEETDRHEGDRLACLLSALDSLPGREAEVIRRRFGLGCQRQTQVVIAQALGITRERVMQVENRGLRRLRERFGVDRRATA